MAFYHAALLRYLVPMPLELKDLATQKPLIVPEEGLTFGREGGDANIQLRDTGVSKRHARVFGENGAWFLEDLGSSNGTWLQKERIKDATELLPGDIFQMSQAKFEVVQVMADGEAAEPTNMARGDDEGAMDEPASEDEATPKPMPAAKEAPSKKNAGAAGAASKEPSISKGKNLSQPPPSKKPPAKAEAEPSKGAAKKPAAADAAVPTDPGAGEPKKITVGYFLVAVPKAFAFYLAAMPVMLFNPVGTIRKGVQEQKHEPKGRFELIAYALPGYLISAAFGFLGALVVGLVSGTLSIGDILPIGALIGAVIGAAVTGFIWHPVLNWWVKFLKGTSDDRSRTNLFMLYMTAFALLALPNFVAMVLSLVHLPLIGLVPLVLRLAASLLTLFIFFTWFSAAGVVKWFRIVLMVLGGLACLSTLAGIPGAIAGSGGVATGGSVDAQVEAAQAQAEALQKQAEAQAEAAEKQAEAAVAQAEKQVAAAEKQVDAAQKQADKAAAAPPPPSEEKKAAPPPPTPAPPPAKPPEAKHAEAAPPVPTGGGYAAWHSKMEAIEKRITDDPTVLKDQAVLGLYRKLEEEAAEVEAKYSKSKEPRRVRDHLRDAELYEKSEKTVGELYGKLFK